MKIVIDKKNEWWKCGVDRCNDEVAYGGSRFGCGVMVCHFHSRPADVPITSIPLDEGVLLKWDERLADWHIEKWDDGVLILTDETFSTISEGIEAWREQNFHWRP